MVKFLQILRYVATAVVLIAVIGMAIFWMNDIGTSAPIAICGWTALAALAVNAILAVAQLALEKREKNREDTP